MRNPTRMTSTVLALVTLVVLLLPAASEAAGAPPTQGVHLTPIGNPTWKPVDVHLFSAPVGTAASGYAEFGATMAALLPPPNHVVNDVLGIGPGAPHQPPYDWELAAGVAKQGYHEGVRFSQAEFSDGMGVWAAWMNVPAPGVIGSSPDFASGPIIPSSVFPIRVEASSIHNGAEFSVLAGFDVPPLTAAGFNVDGHSHFPIFLADNADFGPVGTMLLGSYTWDVTMIDATDSGWRVEVHFTVAP